MQLEPHPSQSSSLREFRGGVNRGGATDNHSGASSPARSTTCRSALLYIMRTAAKISIALLRL